MFEPHNEKRYLIWSFILIIFLLVSGIAVANENGDLSAKFILLVKSMSVK